MLLEQLCLSGRFLRLNFRVSLALGTEERQTLAADDDDVIAALQALQQVKKVKQTVQRRAQECCRRSRCVLLYCIYSTLPLEFLMQEPFNGKVE